jgi:hypothetical protein
LIGLLELRLKHGITADVEQVTYLEPPPARIGMKNIGMEDWLIHAIMEFCYIIRVGHGSRTTNVVEQITGRKPVAFEQFVRDYAMLFQLNADFLS